jgi:hypothetical protein
VRAEIDVFVVIVLYEAVNVTPLPLLEEMFGPFPARGLGTQIEELTGLMCPERCDYHAAPLRVSGNLTETPSYHYVAAECK